MKILRYILGWLLCLVGMHENTAEVTENGGEVPDWLLPEKGEDGITTLAKFRRSSMLYCRRCGREPPTSAKFYVGYPPPYERDRERDRT